MVVVVVMVVDGIVVIVVVGSGGLKTTHTRRAVEKARVYTLALGND